MTEEEMASETKDKKPCDNNEIRIATRTYEHRRRPISDGPSDTGYSIQSAQRADVLSGLGRVQKGNSQDGLRNAQRNDDDCQTQVDYKELT